MIRTYKYHAFPPRSGVDAFNNAVALRRELWANLCAIHREYLERRAAAFAADTGHADALAAWKSATPKNRKALAAALKDAAAAVRESQAFRDAVTWRVDRFREAKQAIAAKGLHWGSYNAVVFQFDGAVAAAAKKGGVPAPGDRSLGEAAVIQLQKPPRPAQLLSGSQTWIEYLPPEKGRYAPGSRRSHRRHARLFFCLRTDRNPMGPAMLELEFMLQRPLPVDGRVVEIRVIRTHREVINRDGAVIPWSDWSVTFVVKTDVPASAHTDVCGVAFDWAADENQPFALVSAPNGIREYTMPSGHAAAWERRKEMFALAEANPDDRSLLAAARIFGRRLFNQRRDLHRVTAASIADRYAVVAIQKIDLGGKGVKKHTAPAEFRLALRHAVAARGGTLIEVPVSRADKGGPRGLAAFLRGEAKKHLTGGGISSCDVTNAVMEQADAA